MPYLAKSSAGKLALQTRASELTARDRQILVLANGKSLRADLEAMLGGAAEKEIDRLAAMGYLVLLSTPASPTGPDSSLQAPRSVPASSRSTPHASDLPKPATQGPASAPAPDPSQAVRLEASVPMRRSIAATKMYIIDMLQMMRRPEASALAAALHTSATEEELLTGALEAVTLMASLSGNSYALKVCTQLLAMVPLPHEPRVRAHAGLYVDALV